MQRGQRNPDGSAAGAAAPALAMLKISLAANMTADEFCAQLSKMFHVHPTEVALLQAQDDQLKFLFPLELKTAGSIPLSSGSAVASHTASGRKAERYNNFLQVKHASIFETIKLGHSGDNTPPEKPIQKLMSAPVLDSAGKIMGVIQVSRKGYELSSAGPDFTIEELRQLERAAGLAAQAAFMRTDSSK